MPLLRRVDIDRAASVIETIYYSDITKMDISHPSDAIDEISKVLDNKILKDRAVHIMEMVKHLPFKSIYSRNLWISREFNQIVQDLMHRIDLEISRVDKLQNKSVETPLNTVDHIGETVPKVPLQLKDIKLDMRWSKRTIPAHIRELEPRAANMTDQEILDAIGYNYTKDLMQDLQKINPLIKVKMK